MGKNIWFIKNILQVGKIAKRVVVVVALKPVPDHNLDMSRP